MIVDLYQPMVLSIPSNRLVPALNPSFNSAWEVSINRSRYGCGFGQVELHDCVRESVDFETHVQNLFYRMAVPGSDVDRHVVR